MRQLPFESEFDAAINFGGSFGYFDDADNTRVVESACRALRAGGRYLIDTVTLETIFSDYRTGCGSKPEMSSWSWTTVTTRGPAGSKRIG